MIDKLILKYLDGSITRDEFEELSLLLKSPKNQRIFKNYIRYYHDVDLSLSPVNLQEDFKIIKSKIHKKRKWVQTSTSMLKYAAVLVIIFGLGYFFSQQNPFSSTIDYVDVPSNKTITIEKQNGEIEEILIGESREITNIHGNVIGQIDQEQLILRENSSAESDVFHTINVPYGSKFKLTLTDGTKIHLNSGSSLKYPLAFKNGMKRKVLLEGEAYFKVAPDKNAPFIVESDGVYSKVLGTEFNYSAYPDDETTAIVLIEGAVGVGFTNKLNEKNSYKILRPSQKATPLISEDRIEVKDVNIQKYIGWTQGTLVFEDDDMKNILKILQRHYDVKIINKYPELNNYRFSGVFKNVKIEDILKTIKTHTPFTFTIKENNVIIKPITKQ